MKRLDIDLLTCREIANKLPQEIILNIIQKHSARSQDEIINILLSENEKFQNLPALTLDPVSQEDLYTLECKIPYCSQEKCGYYHNQKQYRRPQSQFSYREKPCFRVYRNNYWENPSMCPKKNSCEYAHTENEIKHYIKPKNSVYKSGLFSKTNSGYPEDEEINFIQEDCCNTNDIDYLLQNINTLQHEINKKQQESYVKKERLKEINNNIGILASNSLCANCNKKEYSYINIPCGHPMCFNCRCLPNCLKCQNKCEKIVKININ
jgi:hypothetical protein